MAVVNVKNFSFNQNDLIGQGATGSVYKGVDTFNGRVVAIKAIKMSSINNQVTRYLLENQLKALQITDHPNLVKNYDTVRNKDYTYIVMEYCPTNLNTFLKNNKTLPQQKILEIFKQIVQGYKALKDHKIVHRDLKPSNILLTNDLIPKISDLGYCQIDGFLPKPKMFYNVGSPSYMAPEAITKNNYSQKSDVWALGTILYEMINGQTFDKGKKVMQAIMMIGKNGLVFHRPSSPAVQQIIKQCLTLNLAKRITLQKLRQLLNLEKSGVRNTSFYRDDSVLSQQPRLVQQPLTIHQQQRSITNQNSIIIEAKQLQVNRSNAVFKSLVVPTTQYQNIQENIHVSNQPFRHIIRNSIVQKQIPVQQIHSVQPLQPIHPGPTTLPLQSIQPIQPIQPPLQIVQHGQTSQPIPSGQTTSAVMNSLRSPHHHQQTPNAILKSGVHHNSHRNVIQSHLAPIVNPTEISRPNNITRLSRNNNLVNQSRRYVSLSPAKQQKLTNNSSFIQRNKTNLNSSIGQISPALLAPQSIPVGNRKSVTIKRF